MICPYIVSYKIMVQTSHVHDEDNFNTTDMQTEVQTASPMECKLQNCAAWQQGHCVRLA